MIPVSEAWKDVQQRFLLPEMFIEIDCAITEPGAQGKATSSGISEAVFSDASVVTGLTGTTTTAKYATLEPNLWSLDGSRNILPDNGPYPNVGYVSDIAESGSVSLTFPELRTVPIPGVTIVWSSEYGEYPPVFTVAAYNGNSVVAELTVTDNAQAECTVELDMVNYDRVTVTIHNWNLPGHRGRIDKITLGHLMTFMKRDIFSFSHEQHGTLLSDELPKNSVEFSIDNSDNRWNPSNPTGLERYLSERQELTVRYGLDIDGTTEWIKAGTFYLSEWGAPSNGLEARFVARDLLEFLVRVDNKSAMYNTLSGLIRSATSGLLPSEGTVQIDDSLGGYSAAYTGEGTQAEIVQKAANAACCILRIDRDGILHVEPLSRTLSEFRIPLSLAYSHPEITLTKPLKTVSVEYGEETAYELTVSGSGETQTVTNSFITGEDQAALVAEWVRDTLQTRKIISGEFRADPRLDVFDVVTVESKFGAFAPVVITDVKYSFSGTFQAEYTGHVLPASGSSVLGDFIVGKSVLAPSTSSSALGDFILGKSVLA